MNNAALTQHGRFLEVTEATWDRLHRVNAKGAFFCAQRVARQMAAQGRSGRIINLASIAGKGYAQTSNPAYAASNGAVIAMTYIAAHQLAEHDITVNAICPGVVLTPLLEGMLAERAEQTGLSGEELKDRMCGPIPIGRANQSLCSRAEWLAARPGTCTHRGLRRRGRRRASCMGTGLIGWYHLGRIGCAQDDRGRRSCGGRSGR